MCRVDEDGWSAESEGEPVGCRCGTPPPSRGSGRRPGRRAGRAARRAARRPVRDRGRRGAGPGDGAVALAAALAPARPRGRACRRCLRRRRLPHPWSLVAEITGTREDDPWSPDSLAWPLLEVIDASFDEPWAGTLAGHLGHRLPGEEGDLRRGRRFALARRLAGLFASYTLQRPTVLADWSVGRDTDGCGRPVPADLAWQPELWRRLVDRVPAPPPHERHRSTLAWLHAEPGAVELPERLSLFGHTRLAGDRGRAAVGAGPAPRRAPVAAAPVAGAVERARRALAPTTLFPGATTRATGWRRTRCSRAWAATSASCSARCPPTRR